jgi:integrase/recombinase XerD
MEKSTRSIEMLIAAASNYLIKQSFSLSVITKYNREWKKLKSYMTSTHVKVYTKEVGARYLTNLLGDYQRDKLTRNNQQICRRIEFLNEFLETGVVRKRRKSPEIELTGHIGKIMNAFVATRLDLEFCVFTIQAYKRSLHAFLGFMTMTKMRSLQSITPAKLINFIEYYGEEKQAKKHCLLSVVRIFLRYLYDQAILPINYATTLPKCSYTRQSRLPSVYSKDEIAKMLYVIDRGNPKGRRDYAILLIASRLGLRASDICCLKFENLNWEKCLIVLNQYKTGKRLELPISQEIGNAVIDYLKYGRPISDESFVFLNLIPPYDQMTCINLSTLTSIYLTLAGIDCRSRKHGTHALRHSLAANLLKEKTPMPIITEVLGHKDPKSTMYYLRVDIDSLSQCALEVPQVCVSFYKNLSTLCFK